MTAAKVDASCIGGVVVRAFRSGTALFKIAIHFFDVVHHVGGTLFFAKHFAKQLEIVVVLVIEYGFGLIEADEGNAGFLLQVIGFVGRKAVADNELGSGLHERLFIDGHAARATIADNG